MQNSRDTTNELLLTEPDDLVITGLAAELNSEIFTKCRDLARQALQRPVYGSDEWAAEINASDTADTRRAVRHEHLTRLRILWAARVDLERAVLDARRSGATWNEIGAACGVTRQAAYDRWGEAVNRTEEARRKAAESSKRLPDVLDEYDPGGEGEQTPRRSRRRAIR